MAPGPRLEVGRIGRAHGLRGEVSVVLTSERTDRLAPGSVLFAGDRELVVVACRPHQQRWLVRFEGVDDRTAAESLGGAVLTGEVLPSPAGELWVHELVGCRVQDRDGVHLGLVVAVEANPASDLLVIARESGGSGDEVLVPMTFVVEHGSGRVVIDPPAGLLDLNR